MSVLTTALERGLSSRLEFADETALRRSEPGAAEGRAHVWALLEYLAQRGRGSLWEDAAASSALSSGVKPVSRWQEVSTLLTRRPALLTDALGWSLAESAETRSRLGSFADDWDAPGMEAYDEL